MNDFLFHLGFIFWQELPNMTPGIGWVDILWLLTQTIIALALVCGLAVLIFRYILPKLNVISINKSIVQIVDSASLDVRRRLIVVEVGGKYMLLALSENGVQMISELDAESMKAALEQQAENELKKDNVSKRATETFTQIMDRILQKRK